MLMLFLAFVASRCYNVIYTFARVLKMELINVYVAKIPDNDVFLPIYPTERSEYVAAAKSDSVRRERYYVWRLLEHAIADCLRIKTEDISFCCENGRWSCDKCHFSLAHSDGVVAVAISSAPVGVDIEEIKPPRAEGFKDRILSSEERAACGEADAIALWCKKEALFKRGGGDKFIPREVSTVGAECKLRKISVGGSDYYLAVACDHGGEIKLYENIDLK